MSHSLKDFFEHLNRRSGRTFDLLDLKTTYGEIIPLFVYDELRYNQSDNWNLIECPYLGTATTWEDEFVLMRKDSRTVVFRDESDLRRDLHLVRSQMKRIEGDLYGVPLDMIYYLDTQFDNGMLYNREDIPIVLHDQGDLTIRNAQIYIGHFPTWKGKRYGAERFSLGKYGKIPQRAESVYRNA